MNGKSNLHDTTVLEGGIGLFFGNHVPAHFAEHYHSEIQVIIPFEGTSCRATWHSETGKNISRNVHEWHTCITASNQPHQSDWKREAEMLIFYLAPQFIQQTAFDLLKKSKIEIIDSHLTQDAMIQQIAQTLRIEFTLYKRAEKLYIESLSNVLAAHLLRNYSVAGNLLKDVKEELSPFILKKAKEYINERLNEKISLAAVSQAVNLSPYYFARAFKQSTGLTPHQYIIRQRTERAKYLLINNDLTVSQIALQTGWSSQNHFSTVFNRFYGVTPSKFRRAHAKRLLPELPQDSE